MNKDREPGSPTFALHPKKQTESHLHNGMALSGSGSSSDKDSLLDEMQAKIGELLQISQELCSTRNQIDILNQKIRDQQQEFQRERGKLENKIRRLESAQDESTQTISTLQDHIRQLQDDNDQLNTASEQMKQQMKEMELKEQTQDKQTSELKKVIESKAKEVEELREELRQVKAAHSSSSEEVANQRAENRQLATMIRRSAKEKRRANADIAELNEMIGSLQKKLEEETGRTEELIIEQRKLQRELEESRAQEAEWKKKYDEKVEESAETATLIQQILDFPPGFENIETLQHFIEDKQQEVEALECEVKKGNKTIKKCWRMMKDYEHQLEAKGIEIGELDSKLVSHQSEAVKQSIQMKQLQNVIDHQNIRLRLIPVFDRTTSILAKRLSDLFTAVRGEEGPDFSLRPLITLVLMLLRWKTLPGTPRVYTEDSRNFWWMNTILNDKLNSEVILQGIAGLKAELSTSKAEILSLKSSLESIEDAKSQVDFKMKAIENELQSELHRRSAVELELSEARQMIESQIPADIHQELTTKMSRLQGKYDDAKSRLKQLQLEMITVQKSLTDTKQRLSQQMIITKQKDRMLDDAKIDLFEAQEGIIHLRGGNAAKTKDILALERGVNHHKRIARIASAENDILCLENRRMSVQLSRVRSTLQTPDHQFADGRPCS